MTNVIDVQHVCKTYGAITAVDDISFTVQPGEIFGVVGPNGAGKTTMVESVIGLRRPDSGEIRVLGLNPQTQGRELKQRIGIQLQQAALPNDPEVVFLDELTTGLDPQARRATWDAVRAIRRQGKTVVLVTHFMEEAEELADHLLIIDGGKVVAHDTPQALIQNLQAGSRVCFTSQNGFDAAVLRPLPGVSQVEQQGRQITVYGRGPLLSHVVAALNSHNETPLDLRVEQATLEDVFLALTGRKIRD